MGLDFDYKNSVKQFSDLPPELRMLIIDSMSPVDRIMFSLTSKQFYNEAQQSKNFIYGMCYSEFSDERCVLNVRFTGDDTTNNIHFGYSMEFIQENGKTMMKRSITKSHNEQMVVFERALDQSRNTCGHAMEYFSNILKRRQKSLKSLTIVVRSDYPRNFQIKSLDNLVQLGLYGLPDVDAFLRKTSSNLRKLSICTQNKPASFQQINKIKDKLHIMGFPINIEELLKISARSVFLSIGELTYQNIVDFIMNWIKSSVKGESGEYTWRLMRPNFPFNKIIFRLRTYKQSIGQEPGIKFSARGRSIGLKHIMDEKKTANFFGSNQFLKFEWITNNE